MRPDLYTGFLFQSNFHGRSTNMFGEFDTFLETNNEGFRDSNHPINKPTDSIRIAFLGDSFTCAEQVEEKETFVRRAEQTLNSEFKKKVECLNFGISGYDTQQEVLCYENYVRKYHPDIVVLIMYPRNDIMGNIFYKDQQNFGRPYYHLKDNSLIKIDADPKKLQQNYKSARPRLSVRWYQHFQSYNAFKHLRWEVIQHWQRYQLRKNPPLGQDVWKLPWYDSLHFYLEPSDLVVQEAEQITKLLLQRLESQVKADGGRFLVAICPSYSGLWPERWPQRVKFFPGLENLPIDRTKDFREILTYLPELTEQSGILDPRNNLRKSDSLQSIFFHRDNHYNAWGHQAMAQILSEWLKTHLVNFLETNKSLTVVETKELITKH